ncbi:hypothetical protein [Reichenbachiella versicolor]|uniref:hypothetical protein n=1 Tax=Reichenbachiella versicolor TaxID=1821036 RepID=UPI0013A56458|nr:hypothetical protein [Reichenbachiella versicolor]
MKLTLLSLLMLTLIYTTQGQNLKTTSDPAKIYLMEPERSQLKPGSTTSEKYFQLGEMSGQAIFIVSEGEKANPMIYSKMEAESAKAGMDIYFSRMGMYIIAVDANNFLSLYPSPAEPLGKVKWSKFMFSNFFSTDKAKAQGKTKQQLEQEAIAVSEKVL